MNEFDIVDYLNEARGRVTEQFKGKDVFDRYLQLLVWESTVLQNEYRKLMQDRSIDTASGKQLDIIGEIVGRPRGLLTATEFKFFGFQGDPQAGGFGSVNDASQGEAFWSTGQAKSGGRVPTDEEYRLLIKAKIIKNITRATPEDTIDAFKFLFNAGQAFINETGPAKVTIGIGKILTTLERGLLFDFQGTGGLLPKTIGVEYNFQEFQSSRVFALQGFPNAQGPGDLNDPSVGGFISNLV